MSSRRAFLAGSAAALFAPAAVANSAPLRPGIPGSTSDLADLFDEFLDAVRNGQADVVERALVAEPALMFAHDADDVSLYRLAARHPNVTAVLERRGYHPDLLDIASAGDLARLDAIVAAEPRLLALRSHVGETALHAAAAVGQASVVARLTAAGADVNAAEWRNGETALLVALRRAPTGALDDIGRVLIEGGATPNTATRDGTTALHGASARRRRAIVELLIARGARLDAKDANGLTPADISRARGHTELMDLLTGKTRPPQSHPRV